MSRFRIANYAIFAGLLLAAVSCTGSGNTDSTEAQRAPATRQTQTPAAVSWTYNGDGTATGNDGSTVIVGLDKVAGTADDNQIVNPKGTVLRSHVKAAKDKDGAPFVALGNGFNLYGGADGLLGTIDDVVKGFGTYPQSDPTGATREPLDWRLLDIKGSEAVLICSRIVDAVQFNLRASDGNDWKNSNLRSWLNSRGGRNLKGGTTGFYNAAFSEAEKAKINLTRVKMDYSGWPQWDPNLDQYKYQGTHGTYPAYNRTNASPNYWELYTTTGESTDDYVYAISGEEGFEYFGPTTCQVVEGWSLVNYFNGYFTPTEYAKAQGAKFNDGHNGAAFRGNGDTWSRSPGRPVDENGNYYGVFFGATGDFNSGRIVNNIQNNTCYGALPMINVSLRG